MPAAHASAREAVHGCSCGCNSNQGALKGVKSDVGYLCSPVRGTSIPRHSPDFLQNHDRPIGGKMKVRKSLFAVLVVGLLFGGSYIAERASQKAVSAPRLVADGTDPMPKPPRGTLIVRDQPAAGVLLADGTDPMPRPPRGTLTRGDQPAAGVLVVDGTDPMPLLKPTRGLQS
jgi:hypothetical protein